MNRSFQPTKNDLATQLSIFENLPILYEDDPEWDMGEANLHAVVEHLLRYGLTFHFVDQPQFRVFSNLNLHYQPKFPSVYISPDVMVCTPFDAEKEDFKSYLIGRDGPAPRLVSEVLSEETAKERDLDEKVYLYAMIGVQEYILVDESGQFLPQRLLLKRLQPDRTWKDEQDADRGVTSELGFRLIWDHDGQLRVINTATGERYVRPGEAQQEIWDLRLENERLKARAKQSKPKPKQNPKRRRRK